MPLAPLSWLFPAAARVGWATTRVPNPGPDAAAAWAFLLRGNGTVFSPGFGRLCDRLRAAGVWAEDLRCTGDRWVCRRLRARLDAGGGCPPVVLVGHSRGGRRAIVAARQLGLLGVAVDLLVCVDVAFPPPVPGNVRHAAHLFRGGWRVYPARPLRADPATTTVVENVDLSGPDAPTPARGLHHLNITADAAVQDWVVERALRAVGGRAGPARAGAA